MAIILYSETLRECSVVSGNILYSILFQNPYVLKYLLPLVSDPSHRLFGSDGALLLVSVLVLWQI